MRLYALAFLLTACVDHAHPAVALYDKGDYAGAARAADEGLAAHPDDDGLWGMRIRAALALGDAGGVAKAYAAYDKTRDGIDKELVRDLAVATLGQALASPSAKLKIAAIQAVQEAEIESLAEQVAERMGDEDDRVAATAAVAILRAYPQAPQVATDALKSENAEARRIAVDGIGKKVGKLAAGDLEKAGDDGDPRVRATAIRWLGSIKDKDAIELLTKRLHDPDEGVRAASALALAQIGIGNLEALGKTALKDPALPVRLAGIELLAAAHRDDELVPLVDDPDASVGLEAAIAVHKAHPELADKAVARAIAAKDWAVRAGAANSLARALDKPRTLAVAHQLASDADAHVRLAAARALVHAGDAAGAAAIFAAEIADDRGLPPGGSAAEGRRGEIDDRGLPPGGSAAEGRRGEIAVQAAADLAALGDARGIAALDADVRDAKHTPEERAAAAAAHRTAHRVTPGLVAALADANAIVRVEAAAALAVLAR